MSERLWAEVMDYAPASLTWREWYVLQLLAMSFSDDSRSGSPSWDGESEASEQMRRRARCSRSRFYDILQSLADKGTLEVVERGQKGRMAVYKIPQLALQHRRGTGTAPVAERPGADSSNPAQGPSFRDADGAADGFRVPASGTQDAEGADPGPIQGPGNRDAEERTAPHGALRVPETGTLNPRQGIDEDSTNTRRVLDEGSEGLQGPESTDPERAFSVPKARTPVSAFKSPTDGLKLTPPAGRARSRTGEQPPTATEAATTPPPPGPGTGADAHERAQIQEAVAELAVAEVELLLAAVGRIDLPALRRSRSLATGNSPAAVARSQIAIVLGSRPLADWPPHALPPRLRPGAPCEPAPPFAAHNPAA